VDQGSFYVAVQVSLDHLAKRKACDEGAGDPDAKNEAITHCFIVSAIFSRNTSNFAKSITILNAFITNWL